MRFALIRLIVIVVVALLLALLFVFLLSGRVHSTSPREGVEFGWLANAQGMSSRTMWYGWQHSARCSRTATTGRMDQHR